MSAGAKVGLILAALIGLFMIYYTILIEAGATGIPQLDALRPRLAFELTKRGLGTPKHVRAMMSIAHNENSNGAVGAHVIDPMTPGDLGISVGPSVGPFKLSRRLAIKVGVWPASPAGLNAQLEDQADRDAYQAFGTDPANRGELIAWSVIAYKWTLGGASDADLYGDQGVVRLWNGPGEAAVAYRDNAKAFSEATWGASA